jgi:hypothetical protein
MGKWVWLPLTLVWIILGAVGANLLLGLWGVRGALSRGAWQVLRNE